MNIFKSKYSKWSILHVYYYDFYGHIIMARKNLNNGLIQFKTIKINDSMNVGAPIECKECNFSDKFKEFIS